MTYTQYVSRPQWKNRAELEEKISDTYSIQAALYGLVISLMIAAYSLKETLPILSFGSFTLGILMQVGTLLYAFNARLQLPEDELSEEEKIGEAVLNDPLIRQAHEALQGELDDASRDALLAELDRNFAIRFDELKMKKQEIPKELPAAALTLDLASDSDARDELRLTQ